MISNNVNALDVMTAEESKIYAKVYPEAFATYREICDVDEAIYYARIHAFASVIRHRLLVATHGEVYASEEAMQQECDDLASGL